MEWGWNAYAYAETLRGLSALERAWLRKSVEMGTRVLVNYGGGDGGGDGDGDGHDLEEWRDGKTQFSEAESLITPFFGTFPYYNLQRKVVKQNRHLGSRKMYGVLRRDIFRPIFLLSIVTQTCVGPFHQFVENVRGYKKKRISPKRFRRNVITHSSSLKWPLSPETHTHTRRADINKDRNSY